MKTLRVMSIAVLSLVSTVALAQSPAQKSFNEMKAFAGEWEGKQKDEEWQAPFRHEHS